MKHVSRGQSGLSFLNLYVRVTQKFVLDESKLNIWSPEVILIVRAGLECHCSFSNEGNREQNRRQCELEWVYEGGHKKKKNPAAIAMEETGTESSLKHPEKRGPVICTKGHKF